MIIDQFNLNQLRVFEAVFRTRSMTEAAKELHLTQSGVSQHMRGLEEFLGFKLFDRVKQRLLPTPRAESLFGRVAESLNGIEQAIGEARGGPLRVAGTVRVGMPIEFGNNIVMPQLAEFSAVNPGVKFHLRYGFVTSMSEALLDGSLDFAFVDDFALDRRIRSERVFDEILTLCATKSYVRGKGPLKGTKEYFESLEYADYQAGEPVLRKWFEHHLGSSRLDLNVRVTVMDVQGIARLIQAGFCAGILPGYLASKLERESHELHRFKGSGKPLKNTLLLAWLEGRTLSPAAQAAFTWLSEHVKKAEVHKK